MVRVCPFKKERRPVVDRSIGVNRISGITLVARNLTPNYAIQCGFKLKEGAVDLFAICIRFNPLKLIDTVAVGVPNLIIRRIKPQSVANLTAFGIDDKVIRVCPL